MFVLLMGIPFLSYGNQLPRERVCLKEREREREKGYVIATSVALLSRRVGLGPGGLISSRKVGLWPEGLVSGQESRSLTMRVGLGPGGLVSG